MKFITEEEKEALNLEPKKLHRNPVMTAIRRLEVGENLLIEKEEWVGRVDIYTAVSSSVRDFRNSNYQKRFEILDIAKKKGWVIKRIS